MYGRVGPCGGGLEGSGGKSCDSNNKPEVKSQATCMSVYWGSFGKSVV